MGAPNPLDNVGDWIVDEAYVKEITALHYPALVHSSPRAGPSGNCLLDILVPLVSELLTSDQTFPQESRTWPSHHQNL